MHTDGGILRKPPLLSFPMRFDRCRGEELRGTFAKIRYFEPWRETARATKLFHHTLGGPRLDRVIGLKQHIRFDQQAVVSQFIANKINFQGSELSLGLRSRGDQRDRLDDRGIVVFRLVDPGRDRPHPHIAGREGPHQFIRIGLVAQPAGIIGRR